MGRLLRLALLLSPLFLPASSAALRPERPLSQAQVDAWQTENGLPQNTVTSILRTRDGHLWFGTYDGLVRFDGARFTVFDGKSTPLLATGSAFALMEDRSGTLWIGRSENVVQYRDGVFRQVLGDELGQGTVWSLSEAPTGRSGPARGTGSCAGRTARPPS
jgi:ligand-binding sensor domain-containing protein